MGKKILISVTNDLSNDQRMLRISHSLQNAGYEITLLGREKNNSTALIATSFQQKRLRCIFQKGKAFYLEYNLRLLCFCLFSKFDIYYAVDLDSILPMCLVAKWKDKKLVYDAHEYFTEVPEVVNRPFVQKIWDKLGHYCIPKADLAFTVGDMLAKELAKHYGKDFKVVKNVPVLRKNSSSWPSFMPIAPQKFFLYQGALNKGRGLEQLLEVMPKQKHPLLIAGEGDLSQQLRQKAKELNLEHKVYFLGMLNPEDLWQITQHAFIGFNLLENTGKSYYFSLANKFFDYIQASVPSINMDFPEYSKLNKEWQLAELITDLNNNKISFAIDILAEDPVHYAQLQENAKKAAAIFNWENEAKHLISLIHGISR